MGRAGGAMHAVRRELLEAQAAATGLSPLFPLWKRKATAALAREMNGPMFRVPVDVLVGEVVPRDGFVFADLLPGRC
jgi:hypothetical protein